MTGLGIAVTLAAGLGVGAIIAVLDWIGGRLDD